MTFCFLDFFTEHQCPARRSWETLVYRIAFDAIALVAVEL